MSEQKPDFRLGHTMIRVLDQEKTGFLHSNPRHDNPAPKRLSRRPIHQHLHWLSG